MWLTEESSAKKEGVVNNVMSVRGCRKMNIGEKPLDYKSKLGCQWHVERGEGTSPIARGQKGLNISLLVLQKHPKNDLPSPTKGTDFSILASTQCLAFLSFLALTVSQCDDTEEECGKRLALTSVLVTCQLFPGRIIPILSAEETWKLLYPSQDTIPSSRVRFKFIRMCSPPIQ